MITNARRLLYFSSNYLSGQYTSFHTIPSRTDPTRPLDARQLWKTIIRYRRQMIGLAGATVVAIYLFRNQIRALMVKESSKVASQTLETEQVKKKLLEQFEWLLEQPEFEKKCLIKSKDIVLKTLEDPDVKKKISETAKQILEEEEVKKQAKNLASEIVTALLQDEKVEKEGHNYVSNVIRSFFWKSKK